MVAYAAIYSINQIKSSSKVTKKYVEGHRQVLQPILEKLYLSFDFIASDEILYDICRDMLFRKLANVIQDPEEILW